MEKTHIDADFLSGNPVDEIKKVETDSNVALNLEDVNVVLSQGSKNGCTVGHAKIELLDIRDEGGGQITIDKVDVMKEQKCDDVIAPVYRMVETDTKIGKDDRKKLGWDTKIRRYEDTNISKGGYEYALVVCDHFCTHLCYEK